MKLSEAMEWLGRTDGLYLYGRLGEINVVEWVVGCNAASGESVEEYAAGATPLKAILAARKVCRNTFMDPKRGGLV